MPINKYFKGSGEEVMRSMVKQYGAKKGKQVFYATANKQGLQGHVASLKAKGKLKPSKYSRRKKKGL